jgi:hypothetical protein
MGALFYVAKGFHLSVHTENPLNNCCLLLILQNRLRKVIITPTVL